MRSDRRQRWAGRCGSLRCRGRWRRARRAAGLVMWASPRSALLPICVIARCPAASIPPHLTGETVAILRAWLTERRGQPDEPLFPITARTIAQPLRGRRGHLEVRRRSSRQLPIADGQAGHPAHAPAHQRDAATSKGRRHRNDRAVARPCSEPGRRSLTRRRGWQPSSASRASRIGRLAAAIGMSKSGLYAHFGAKRELQLATIQSARETFIAEVLRHGTR